MTGGAEMGDEVRRRLWHPGVESVTTVEIEWASGGPGPGPEVPAQDGVEGEGYVKGEPLKWSAMTRAEQMACLDVLWEMNEELDEDDDPRPRPGGKRQHGGIENLIYEFVALGEGYRGAERELLHDKVNWKRLRRTVKKRYRDRPERRLTPKAPSRSQNYRYAKKCFRHDTIDRLQYLMARTCLRAVLRLGGLDPKTGTHAHPVKTQLFSGDGTVMALPFKNRPQECLDHDEDDINHRCDNEACSHYAIGSNRGGPRGYMAIKVLWRAPYTQHRILVTFDLRTPGKGDGTVFVDLVEQLMKDFPELLGGLRGTVYDMHVEGRDVERQLDLDLIPIGKVPRTKGKNSKVAEFNLGPHEFRRKEPSGGTTTVATLPLFALDGPPIIKRVDGSGIVHHIPLIRKRHNPQRYTRRSTLYVEWALPAHPLVPEHLVGAFTNLRHNSTPEELAASAAGRSSALRVICEHDPDFDPLMGLRQDTESSNSTLKRIMGRARGHGSRRFRLHMLSYQLLLLITSLVAHQEKTGENISDFFGGATPAARDGP